MRYYAQYNESGKLLAIGTGPGGIEITEEEYNRLRSEIRTKAELVDKLYNEEITISDVPTEWQEEIQQRGYHSCGNARGGGQDKALEEPAQ